MEKKEDKGFQLEEFAEEGRKKTRTLKGVWALLIIGIAISMSLFHIYTAGFGVLLALKQRAIHVGFVFALVFLLYPARKGSLRKGSLKDKIPLFDIMLAVMGIVVTSYILINYNELVVRAGNPTTLDLVLGAITILLAFEATRRCIGPVLPIVAICFLLYGYFGPYMPALIAHKGYSLSRLLEHMYLTTEGVFGIPIGVCSTFVVMFIIFGAFLEKTGVGPFFINTSFAALGHKRGGPAKAAVVSSGLIGMISGSSVANVATTGTFTIPLMKKVGFKPHVAGGVEVAASTNGQFTPPIMGAAAFIMAEFTGIPYLYIVLAALAPSILDYVAILFLVDFEALKSGIGGLPRDQLPDLKKTLLAGFHLLAPVVGIIYLLAKGYTPMRAAFVAIFLSIGVGFIRKETRPSLKDLLKALEMGALKTLGVACACACAGIVVGVVLLTGLGLHFANVIMVVSHGQLLPALLLSVVTCIILGLGVPTTANYIIMATMVAPALIRIGVPLIAAHLFVFYYGVAADDTPPVGLAAFAAAGIANSNPITTGVQGAKFDLSGFIIPFAFVFSPVMVLVNFSLFPFIWTYISTMAGMYAFSIAIQGYFLTKTRFYERWPILAAAVFLVTPGSFSRIVGFGILILIFLLQKARTRGLSWGMLKRGWLSRSK